MRRKPSPKSTKKKQVIAEAWPLTKDGNESMRGGRRIEVGQNQDGTWFMEFSRIIKGMSNYRYDDQGRLERLAEPVESVFCTQDKPVKVEVDESMMTSMMDALIMIKGMMDSKKDL